MSEARRAMSGVWVLGEGAAIPSPPAMGLGERCKFSWWSGGVQSKARPLSRCSHQLCLKVVSLVLCAQVILPNIGWKNI